MTGGIGLCRHTYRLPRLVTLGQLQWRHVCIYGLYRYGLGIAYIVTASPGHSRATANDAKYSYSLYRYDLHTYGLYSYGLAWSLSGNCNDATCAPMGLDMGLDMCSDTCFVPVQTRV